PEPAVAELTGGLRADVALEAVGPPETFEPCDRLVRPAGHLANVGVHGAPVTPQLEDLWLRNMTRTTGLHDHYHNQALPHLAAPATLHLEDLRIRTLTNTTGLVDTHSPPTLLDMAAAGRLDPAAYVTHLYPLHDMEAAYRTFSVPAGSGALKVVLSRNGRSG